MTFVTIWCAAQGFSALMMASKKGRMNCIAALLACGAVQTDESRRMLMDSIISQREGGGAQAGANGDAKPIAY